MTDSGNEFERRARGRGALFRQLGVAVLLLSLVAAVTVYEVRTRSARVMEDPMLANFSKADTHQMEVLYGRMGSMIDDFLEDLKRPGVQAFLIAGSGGAIAIVCFFVAGRMEDGDDIGQGSRDIES